MDRRACHPDSPAGAGDHAGPVPPAGRDSHRLPRSGGVLHLWRLPAALWAGGVLHVAHLRHAVAPVFPGPSPPAAVLFLLPHLPELYAGRVPVGGPQDHLSVLRAYEPRLLCVGGTGGDTGGAGRRKDLSDHRCSGRSCDADGAVPAPASDGDTGAVGAEGGLRRRNGPHGPVVGGSVRVLRLRRQGGCVPAAHLAAQGTPGGPGPRQRSAVGCAD